MQGWAFAWRPREANTEADDLTNGAYTAFTSGRRIPVKWSEISLPMVDLLMKHSEAFSKRKPGTLESEAVGGAIKFQETT